MSSFVLSLQIQAVLYKALLSIYIDYYFTSVPLFEELQACEFGAVGTSRPYAEFPSRMNELRERFSKKLDQNTFIAKIVQNTLCLA
jgi:hypothetical protein